MAEASPPRWLLRLDHYRRAVDLLAQAVSLDRGRGLSELEKAGLIQRFEIAWALGRKLMADQLRPIDSYTPMAAIRAAVAAGAIADGEGWVAAGKLRNTLSHAYSEEARDKGIATIGGSLASLAGFAEAMERRRDAA